MKPSPQTTRVHPARRPDAGHSERASPPSPTARASANPAATSLPARRAATAARHHWLPLDINRYRARPAVLPCRSYPLALSPPTRPAAGQTNPPPKLSGRRSGFSGRAAYGGPPRVASHRAHSPSGWHLPHRDALPALLGGAGRMAARYRVHLRHLPDEDQVNRIFDRDHSTEGGRVTKADSTIGETSHLHPQPHSVLPHKLGGVTHHARARARPAENEKGVAVAGRRAATMTPTTHSHLVAKKTRAPQHPEAPRQVIPRSTSLVALAYLPFSGNIHNQVGNRKRLDARKMTSNFAFPASPDRRPRPRGPSPSSISNNSPTPPAIASRRRPQRRPTPRQRPNSIDCRNWFPGVPKRATCCGGTLQEVRPGRPQTSPGAKQPFSANRGRGAASIFRAGQTPVDGLTETPANGRKP